MANIRKAFGIKVNDSIGFRMKIFKVNREVLGFLIVIITVSISKNKNSQLNKNKEELVHKRIEHNWNFEMKFIEIDWT